MARLIVERNDLQPPVDIRALCEEHATVREIDWPQSKIDALLYRRANERPLILLRRDAHPRRQRFTLGHEFGHMQIAWHIGDLTCRPNYEVLDLTVFGAEEQADIFASGILLPDRWMADLLVHHREDMNAIIASLNDAAVSSMAALLALKQNLYAGWAFALYDPSGIKHITTTGTRILGEGDARLSWLRDTALDSGSVTLQERRVEWFRLRDVADMPTDVSAESPATDYLRAALAEYCGSQDERQRYERIFNGKVGGILRQAQGRPATELFATLEYRIQEDHPDLLSIPDFRTWLAIKALAIEAGATKRGRRR